MMENQVYLAKCPDYERSNVRNAVHQALEAFGGASSFSVKGKRVLLKVNLLSANQPESSVTTHPEVVSAISQEFTDAGAQVIIADSPAGPYHAAALRRTYSVCGMDQVANETGAALNFDTTHRRVPFQNGKFAKEFDVITPVLEADLVISVAKLKTHGLAYYTGAVKNLFGTIPGLEKAAFHSRYPNKYSFNGVLVDICELIRPQISFVDGVMGMEGAGPSGGTPKYVGVIGASKNPYALDMAMCDLVALPLSQVPVLVEAISQNLVPSDLSGIHYIGEDPRVFRTHFLPAVSGGAKSGLGSFALRLVLPQQVREKVFHAMTAWPWMTDQCIACGKCVEICPRQVISIRENQRSSNKIHGKKAIPDYGGCIRCYCCHEVCPVKAIDLVKRRKLNKLRSQAGI